MMIRSCSLLILALLLSSCGGNPQPRILPETEREGRPGDRKTMYVIADTLNVRSRPVADAEVVEKVRRGSRVEVEGENGEWSRIRFKETTGWVATRYLGLAEPRPIPRKAAARGRPGCPADRPFRFSQQPRLGFSVDGPHGLVTIEADVEASGAVTSTRVIANTTGSKALAEVAQKELRTARFDPPIRNCRPSPFIYTYKRAF